MKYMVRVWSAIHGDATSLFSVARAMARHAASGYGTLPLHGPSFENLFVERRALLLHAAKNGLLTVCDAQGRVATAEEIVDTAEIATASPDLSDLILHLHVRSQHLVEWGKTNGDDFYFVETPGVLTETDLKTENGAVIESGYYRGAIGGGEFEPYSSLETTGVSSDVLGRDLADAGGPPTGMPPKLRQVAQEQEILAVLTSRGWNPRALPKGESGKPGVKAAVQKALGDKGMWASKTVFLKAWQRLRTTGAIVNQS